MSHWLSLMFHSPIQMRRIHASWWGASKGGMTHRVRAVITAFIAGLDATAYWLGPRWLIETCRGGDSYWIWSMSPCRCLNLGAPMCLHGGDEGNGDGNSNLARSTHNWFFRQWGKPIWASRWGCVFYTVNSHVVHPARATVKLYRWTNMSWGLSKQAAMESSTSITTSLWEPSFMWSCNAVTLSSLDSSHMHSTQGGGRGKESRERKSWAWRKGKTGLWVC